MCEKSSLLSAVMCRNSGELHLVSFRVDEKQVVSLFFYTAGVKSRGFCVHLQFKKKKRKQDRWILVYWQQIRQVMLVQD